MPTLDGRLEAAMEARARLVARSEELGSPVFGRQNASVATLRPLLYLGRGEEALAALPQPAQMAGAEEAADSVVRRALCLAHLGQFAEARNIMGPYLREGDLGAQDEERPVWISAPLLETAVTVGDGEAAAVLARRLAGLASLAGAGTDSTCLGRHLN